MECTIKNISINYEVIGKGKPILMLHGYTLDHKLMEGCMEPIFKYENDFKRIYIDLPGMGRSNSAKWITDADIMLEILMCFIEKVIPNENFLLVGESYGGYLSRGIIDKISNRIDGLLLICPVIIANNKERNVAQHAVIVKDDKLLSNLSKEDAKDFNSTTVIQSERIYERYKNEIVAGINNADMNFLNNFKENGYEISFDVDKMSEKFDKPTLIMVGKQDSCVGYKDAWNILDKFSRATFAVLDSAGHNLQIEQEQLFNSLVSEWIMRVKR